MLKAIELDSRSQISLGITLLEPPPSGFVLFFQILEDDAGPLNPFSFFPKGLCDSLI